MKGNKVYIIGILIVLGQLTACGPSPQEGNGIKSPNVLFILADDLGWKDLSYSGSAFYETPHIDRIASNSFLFTNGYANCQVCSPSRASIMTGKFPARHGITDYIGARTDTAWRKSGRYSKLLPPEYLRALPHADTTLAEAFKEAGYVTFFAGKWHLGPKGSWPEDHGFDLNKGGWDSGSPRGGFFSPWKNPNLENRKKGENLSLRLADETVSFIRNHHPDSTGRPFFAYLSFYAVHSPIQTTRERWKKYRDKAEKMGIAPSAYEMGHFLPIRQVQDNPIYAGLVETMDDAVGRVLQTIEELELAENTIIVFTSDNGGVAAGDAYSTTNLPLRAGKGYQYEGGVREPFLISVPWLEKREIDDPAIGSDLYPTLLDLAGIPLKPHQHLDGISLKPAISGEPLPERALIWHYPHYGNQGGRPSSMIRRGKWKFIHYYEDGSHALYDLLADPGEHHNLSTEYPAQVKSLKNALFDYLNEVGAKYPRKDPEYDAEKEKAFLDNIRNEFMPRLEERRMEILSPDFDPGDWWGSEPGE